MEFNVAATTGVQSSANTGLRLLSLGPNPAHGIISLEATLPTDAPANVSLYDVSGRLISSTGLDGPGQRAVRFGEDTALAAGIYIVRLTQGTHRAQMKELILPR